MKRIGLKQKLLFIKSIILLIAVAIILTFFACSTNTDNATSKHSFDRRVIEDRYICSQATCLNKAKYYFSCECGEKGTETFESGEVLNHEFTDYVYDNNATYESDGTKTAKCNRGCGATNTLIEYGSKLKSSFAFDKNFVVDGVTARLTVPSATEEIDFTDYIIAKGQVQFVIYKDLNFSQEIVNKRLLLQSGENYCYISVKVDEREETYKVLIYKLSAFTVTFNTAGGEIVKSQTVDENSLIFTPEISRQGYTLVGWDYDFSKPITSDTTITAIWTANDDTPYRVEYYLENLSGDGYDLAETQNKKGVTDTTVYAEILSFEHFTPKESAVEGVVTADGKAVLKVYYTRNQYTVTFCGDGGSLLNGEEIQSIRYGLGAVAPTYARAGYIFKCFSQNFSNVQKDLTIFAVWEKEVYKITYQLNGCLDNGLNPETYTVETDTINLLPLVWDNYEFLGWFNNGEKVSAITKGNVGDITLTAKWKSKVFLISNGVILGLTDYGKTLTHLEIIDSINGESISEIGEEAFYNNQTIVSVVIPEGIVNIGKNAFGKCSKLNSATFVQPKTWYANVNGIERQLSVTVLKNKTQSANYLKQNFNAYSWQRKTQN